MSKTIYRIMGIMVSLVLAVGGFTKVQATASRPAVAGTTSSKPVYVYYYLWWSTQHWKDKLGSNYPYSASPLPLPAKTDADGCKATSNYSGNHLLDVPTALVSQDDPGVIEADIRTARNAGVTGFWLNWVGDGTTSQTRTSITYTRRLSEAFAASNRVGGFKNWVSYKVASRQSTTYIINDLNFLYNTFKGETAWEKIDGKPVVTFTGSRLYSNADVQKISNAVRDRIYLVGDETKTTLTATRLAMFDAITYYWSSQDPFGNPQSFDQIKAMGDMIHAAGKHWYAPLAPGYNSALLNGSGNCVPRRNGDALRALWTGNSKSNPDGWGLISWNEIAENTHIKPMQKWGSTYVNVLASLIGSASQPQPPAPTASPSTSGTLDDKNSAWSYTGSWTTYSGSGPYNNSLHYSDTAGSAAEISFNGTRFTLIFSAATNRGSIDVYVDGSKIDTVNTYSASTHWQQTYTSPALAAGSHTARFVHAGGNTYIDIDAIQISG